MPYDATTAYRYGADPMTLAEFLLARIANVEATARDMQHQERAGRPLLQILGGGTGIRDLVDPARVLAECEAKRGIVALHTSSARDPFYSHKGALLDTCDVCVNFHADRDCSNEPWPCPTLRLLALPYADHPDMREEWRP